MYYNINEIKSYMKFFPKGKAEKFCLSTAEEFMYAIDEDDVPSFDYDTGATKLAIIPRDRDYVIKIPFEWNDEEDIVFCEAIPSVWGSSNYIEAEIDVYWDAKCEGFEKLFLPNTYLFSVEDILPVYVQPKCEVFNDMSSEEAKKFSSEKSKNKVLWNYSNITENGHFFGKRLPEEWVASCLDFLGSEKELIRLQNFLEDNNILYDLHVGNIGFLKGKPVILDYGGYNEDF